MQDIKNIRIDERLVHGQVATVWLRKLKVGRCIVIDDAAAANDLERLMLRSSTPQDIKLSVLSVGAEIRRAVRDDRRPIGTDPRGAV